MMRHLPARLALVLSSLALAYATGCSGGAPDEEETGEDALLGHGIDSQDDKTDPGDPTEHAALATADGGSPCWAYGYAGGGPVTDAAVAWYDGGYHTDAGTAWTDGGIHDDAGYAWTDAGHPVDAGWGDGGYHHDGGHPCAWSDAGYVTYDAGYVTSDAGVGH